MDDLESRSMRENLMFYGINGGGDNENFEDLVKNVCSKNTENNHLTPTAIRPGSSPRLKRVLKRLHFTIIMKGNWSEIGISNTRIL